MRFASSHARPRELDKKRTVILLRAVLVISTSYLILAGEAAASAMGIAYILALLASSIALCFAPREWFYKPGFSGGLLLADTAVVLTGLYLTVGCFSQDFLIIYFFTIFLTTATHGAVQIALGAAMVSGLYGYWLWITSADALGAGEWLRLPFFFIVAVFYAYMTEETKYERWRRQQAEREGRRLKFLLELGDGVSPGRAERQIVATIGQVITAAFPRLTCTRDTDAPPSGDTATWFPLRSHGESFGGLRIVSSDDIPLSQDEERFCGIVALVAANALCTAKQINAAGESAKVKEAFLATLSHELRTPIHAIAGYTEMLESVLEGTPDELAHESIGRLRANVCHLQDLVDEMLWFAELRAGYRTVQEESVDLRELFAQLANTMHTILEGRPIQFAWEVDPDVPVLQSDRRKISQLVGRLLSNAAKFTQKGSIHLSAACAPDSQIEIAVQDSGIGIHPKDFALIFEEFRQLDSSLTRRVDGIGLGLALVQELTNILGGRIEVESAPGRGATFRVHLPVNAAPAAEASTAAAIPAPLRASAPMPAPSSS